MTIEYINAQPWEQQYEFNALQSGDITGWVSGTSLPVTVYAAACAITKNRAFILSGTVHGASSSTRCFSAPIDDDGIIGTWIEITSLPTGGVLGSAVIIRNRLYFFGKNSYYATINSDGTLGTWNAGPSMLYACSGSKVVITKNKIYLVGGYKSSAPTAEVLVADISESGVIGTFSYYNSLPAAKYCGCLFSCGNKIYITGGLNVSFANQKTVFVSIVDANDGTIGEWTTTTSMPKERQVACSAAVGGNVYLFGGIYSPAEGTTSVYRATVDIDGNLGAWGTGTVLPATSHSACLLITSSRIYIIGGAIVSSSIYAPFVGGLNDYIDQSYYIPSFWTNFKGQTEILE